MSVIICVPFVCLITSLFISFADIPIWTWITGPQLLLQTTEWWSKELRIFLISWHFSPRLDDLNSGKFSLYHVNFSVEVREMTRVYNFYCTMFISLFLNSWMRRKSLKAVVSFLFSTISISASFCHQFAKILMLTILTCLFNFLVTRRKSLCRIVTTKALLFAVLFPNSIHVFILFMFSRGINFNF